MTYLIILFISPLYFVLRNRWGAFAVNAVLYGLACLFLISFVGAFIAPFFWLLAVGHAGWYVRQEMMAEHAEMIASKMAEKVNQKGNP